MTRRFVLIALALMGVALAAASFLPQRPRFVWNFTASAPVGLYRVLDRPWRRGDWAAAAPAPQVRSMLERFGALEPDRLLIKRIAAAEGDEVCRRGRIVTVNGIKHALARAQTSAGVQLPVWAGCRRLGPGEVFLLGQTWDSFDGRYFGITTAVEIVAPLNLVAAIPGEP